MSRKYGYLLKNIGLMTISNFSSKILSLLLIPLYTRALSAAEYGIYDICSTTCFLLVPILSVCVADAILRFSLEKKDEMSSIFSVAIKFYIRACLIIIILVALNNFFGAVEIFKEYSLYFVLYFAFSLLSDIMTQFSRGTEQVLDAAIAGIFGSITLLTSNVLLLVIFPLGIEGYFISYCLSFFVVAAYLFVKLRAWKYFVFIKQDIVVKKEMITYSAPLVINQIGWWINNVSDRYIVTMVCGTTANGIYSVAYKLPSILTMFQTIFNQAWTISAVKEFDEDNSKFYCNIYDLYNCGMVIVCSGLIVIDKLLAKVLFGNEFYEAWRYAPFLIISAVFVSLAGVFEGIINAAKKSKIIAQTTAIGAIVNLVLNIVLVYRIGPLGAAIATMISYFLVWFTRLMRIRNIVCFSIKLRQHMVSYGLLVLQSVVLLCKTNEILLCLIETILFMTIILIYSNELLLIAKRVFIKVRRERG